MATDWDFPVLTSTYIEVLDLLKARDVDAITLNKVAVTNLPVGAMRYDRTTDKLQEWDGTTWITKVLSIGGGGTGATSPSGIIAAMGLGTMSLQDFNNVNITGGSIVGTVITAASLAYSKIQNVNDVRLLGRSAGSAGPMMEIQVQGLNLLSGILASSLNIDIFTTVGANTWTVPKTATFLCLLVGGGGGGMPGINPLGVLGGGLGGIGGCGGELKFFAISFTVAESITVTIGAGGASGSTFAAVTDGTDTTIKRSSTVLATGRGGKRGQITNGSQAFGVGQGGQNGGGYFGGQGGLGAQSSGDNGAVGTAGSLGSGGGGGGGGWGNNSGSSTSGGIGGVGGSGFVVIIG